MIHRLMGLLLLSVASIPAALAQGALPAPPNQTEPATSGPALPPVNGTAEDCSKGYFALREDAAKVGVRLNAASDRHAPPEEACELINDDRQAL
jgi:hypothetical protein